jgi:hypothetical protein
MKENRYLFTKRLEHAKCRIYRYWATLNESSSLTLQGSVLRLCYCDFLEVWLERFRETWKGIADAAASYEEMVELGKVSEVMRRLQNNSRPQGHDGLSAMTDNNGIFIWANLRI